MKVVYFDGYCSLCNGIVDFLMKIDSRKRLRFASLQGTTARADLAPDKIQDLNTLVYQRGLECFERSTAVIRILEDIGGPWRVLIILLIVPRFLRDALYRWVARNRMGLFGRRETCRVPTLEERERFLP